MREEISLVNDHVVCGFYAVTRSANPGRTTGSHLDLLILTVHKLLVAGSDRLGTLYHCFLTVLCNVSPYAKRLSLVASVKLLNLFELFTSPG